MDKIETYIDSVRQLPPAPTLLNELLGLFRDPDRDIDRIVELLSLDASLTAEVLKRCNSVLLGGANPASDMFEAVSRLGFYEVYCLVVAMFGAKTKSLPGLRDALDVSKLWRHTVITAVAASTIATKTGAPQGGAFTAGLLHDVGKLVLASVERWKYAKAFEMAAQSGQPSALVEMGAFGADHAQIGGRLLERWNLPEEVFIAVRYHHEPSAAPKEQEMAALVHSANWIAHGLDDGTIKSQPLTAVTGKAFVSLKLGPADLPKLNESTLAGLEKVKGLLEL